MIAHLAADRSAAMPVSLLGMLLLRFADCQCLWHTCHTANMWCGFGVHVPACVVPVGFNRLDNLAECCGACNCAGHGSGLIRRSSHVPAQLSAAACASECHWTPKWVVVVEAEKMSSNAHAWAGCAICPADLELAIMQVPTKLWPACPVGYDMFGH